MKCSWPAPASPVPIWVFVNLFFYLTKNVQSIRVSVSKVSKEIQEKDFLHHTVWEKFEMSKKSNCNVKKWPQARWVTFCPPIGTVCKKSTFFLLVGGPNTWALTLIQVSLSVLATWQRRMLTSMEGDLLQNVDEYFNLDWIKISPAHLELHIFCYIGKRICIQHSPFLLLNRSRNKGASAWI